MEAHMFYDSRRVQIGLGEKTEVVNDTSGKEGKGMKGKDDNEEGERTRILLGELAKFGLDAAMPHAHPGQS